MMWKTTDVVHFKVQLRTSLKGVKDHETSVRIANDCVEI